MLLNIYIPIELTELEISSSRERLLLLKSVSLLFEQIKSLSGAITESFTFIHRVKVIRMRMTCYLNPIYKDRYYSWQSENLCRESHYLQSILIKTESVKPDDR